MKVAVGIITDANKRILITQRSLNSPHGGFWEFPGGKLEPFEADYLALLRELKEEVGLEVEVFRSLGEINFHYGARPIALMVYHVTQTRGVPYCRESQQDLRWVHPSELNQYQFPPANDQLIERFILGDVCRAEAV